MQAANLLQHGIVRVVQALQGLGRKGVEVAKGLLETTVIDLLASRGHRKPLRNLRSSRRGARSLLPQLLLPDGGSSGRQRANVFSASWKHTGPATMLGTVHTIRGDAFGTRQVERRSERYVAVIRIEVTTLAVMVVMVMDERYVMMRAAMHSSWQRRIRNGTTHLMSRPRWRCRIRQIDSIMSGHCPSPAPKGGQPVVVKIYNLIAPVIAFHLGGVLLLVLTLVHGADAWEGLRLQWAPAIVSSRAAVGHGWTKDGLKVWPSWIQVLLHLHSVKATYISTSPDT